MSLDARTPKTGDPGRASQVVFRAVMQAMARPGTIGRIDGVHGAPTPLSPGCAALAVTLCDFETPIWLDPILASAPGVGAFLRFETGAPLAPHPDIASFAFIGDPLGLPSLEAFGLGTLECPDRSTTLVLAVETLDDDGAWLLAGPGISDKARFSAWPLPVDFIERRHALTGLFPRGLDMILVAGDRVAALPRTTRVTEA